MAMIDEWSAGCLRQQLRVDKALRSGRTRRLPRSPLAGLPRRSRRPWIEGAQISVRPPQAAVGIAPGLMEVVMTRKDHCHGT